MSELDELAAAVLRSRKYVALCPETVRRIGERELAKGRQLKAAIKATKRRLHQVFGAFDDAPDYERLLAAIEAAFASGSHDTVRDVCRAAMRSHASTRERLPLLDEFYATIFAVTGTPTSVLDLACGLHPLSLPWMGLPLDARYTACDIDGRAVAFLTRFFRVAGIQGEALHRDILCDPPAEPADVAFLLKTLPGLERQEPGSAARLLEALRARHLVVSFPVATLGGRDKGMPQHYERVFADWAADGGERVEKLEFGTELVFVVTRQA